MTYFRLQVFYSVAKNLSFTKASQELYISQPAITRHISKLEETYGVRLFERQGSRIALTKAGETMLNHCEKILAEYSRLSYAMHLLNNEHVGHLRIGASTTISQYVLPPCLAEFIEDYPKTDVSLISGNSGFIEQELISHNIELGMVESISHLPALNCTPFYEDQLILLTGSDNPIAAKKSISKEELKTLPLVMRERGSGSLETISSTLSKYNIPLSELNIRIYLGSTEAIKLFVKNTDTLCIMSKTAVKRELAEGSMTAIETEDLCFKRKFCFVTSPGPQSPMVERFKEFVKQKAENGF